MKLFSVILLLVCFGANAQTDLNATYGIGGFAMRNEGPGWKVIDNHEHEPLVDSVWNDGGKIYFRQKDTAVEVVSWIVSKDETLNHEIGVSAGLNTSWATIKKKGTDLGGALLWYTNVWNVQSYYGAYDNGLQIEYDSTTYLIKVTHKYAEHKVSKEEIPRSRDTSACFQLVYANQTIDFRTTYLRMLNCKGGFRHPQFGDRIKLTWIRSSDIVHTTINPNYVTSTQGNYWVMYIYKK